MMVVLLLFFKNNGLFDFLASIPHIIIKLSELNYCAPCYPER